MENLSKQELISTVTKQADQIKRYETRLRDVVTAYKGLAKEKEALEISLKALNKTDSHSDDGDQIHGEGSVAALTESLATLSAEKSRMEEAFQVDKKVTRDKYEHLLTAAKDETSALVQQLQAEITNWKAKVGYEIQEREKERADNAAMIKELQVKLKTELRSKERSSEDKQSLDAQGSSGSLEKRVRDLSGELQAARRRLARAERAARETPAALVRLHEQAAALEASHALAMREEQIKVKRAEEAARKASARQEQRVAALEARLAELSLTVGEYHARRRRDEAVILQLKESLNTQLLGQIVIGDSEPSTHKSETDNEKLADNEYLHNLIDKIHLLKKELIIENEKLGYPIDLTTIFKVEGYENVHTKCKTDLESLKSDFENYKKMNKREGSVEKVDNDTKCQELTYEVEALKEKVETYKTLLEEETRDKTDTLKLCEEKLKSEKEYQSAVAADLKLRIQSLEKQVATQRDRYAALLDETDQLIRARNDRSRRVSEDAPPLQDAPAPHMLHYEHERARRDLDAAQLRRDKHALEGRLRDTQRESTIEKERFKEVLRTLKDEIERLRRAQTREGANIEYLKNVVLAYLTSAHEAGRRHMLNAIAAVLHLTEAETDLVMATL